MTHAASGECSSARAVGSRLQQARSFFPTEWGNSSNPTALNKTMVESASSVLVHYHKTGHDLTRSIRSVLLSKFLLFDSKSFSKVS